LAVNVSPPISKLTVVSSTTCGGKKMATKRVATKSYILRSIGDNAGEGFWPVGTMAWWSVSLASST
jgi:hypothetical protein